MRALPSAMSCSDLACPTAKWHTNQQHNLNYSVAHSLRSTPWENWAALFQPVLELFHEFGVWKSKTSSTNSLHLELETQGAASVWKNMQFPRSFLSWNRLLWTPLIAKQWLDLTKWILGVMCAPSMRTLLKKFPVSNFKPIFFEIRLHPHVHIFTSLYSSTQNIHPKPGTRAASEFPPFRRYSDAHEGHAGVGSSTWLSSFSEVRNATSGG